jgi:hypothetical protein
MIPYKCCTVYFKITFIKSLWRAYYVPFAVLLFIEVTVFLFHMPLFKCRLSKYLSQLSKVHQLLVTSPLPPLPAKGFALEQCGCLRAVCKPHCPFCFHSYLPKATRLVRQVSNTELSMQYPGSFIIWSCFMRLQIIIRPFLVFSLFCVSSKLRYLPASQGKKQTIFKKQNCFCLL